MPMNRRWVDFKGTAARRKGPGRLYASLNSAGEFVMDLRTYELMGAPEAFVLTYDERNDAVGLRATTAEYPYAVIARDRGQSSTVRVVRSKPFCQKHDIQVERTVMFPTATIEDDTLVLPLHDRVSVSRDKWWKKRRR